MKRVTRELTTEVVNELTRSQIASVYSGKAGCCACGCSGKHYANNQDNASMITRVINVLQANVDKAEYHLSCLNDIVTLKLGKRMYVAYLHTKEGRRGRKRSK